MCMYENLTSYSKSSARHTSANTVLHDIKSEPDQAFYSYSKQTSYVSHVLDMWTLAFAWYGCAFQYILNQSRIFASISLNEFQ